MNNRIVSELIEKANEWSYEEYNYKETGYTREQLYSKKLAELVVLECINCYSPDDSATDWSDKMRKLIEP
jgi:hypothetical protein